MKGNATVLGLNKLEKFLIVLVPMVIGGSIGWFIPDIADWILTLPVVPMEKLIVFIASFNSLWVSIVATMIGIVVGVLLAFIIFDESLEVTISCNRLHLKLGDKENMIEKKDISTIFLEQKQLIILGQNSFELYREVLDVKAEIVREAFHQHQYPWAVEDPYDSQYQRWVLGHPDFSEKVNAFLHAREHSLKEKNKEVAKYLREDLAELGVVIRDERNGQYVRLVEGANHES